LLVHHWQAAYPGLAEHLQGFHSRVEGVDRAG
jgi:hypothetical protein